MSVFWTHREIHTHLSAVIKKPTLIQGPSLWLGSAPMSQLAYSGKAKVVWNLPWRERKRKWSALGQRASTQRTSCTHKCVKLPRLGGGWGWNLSSHIILLKDSTRNDVYLKIDFVMDLIVFLPTPSFSSNSTQSTVPKTCRYSAPSATVTLRSNSLTDSAQARKWLT